MPRVPDRSVGGLSSPPAPSPCPNAAQSSARSLRAKLAALPSPGQLPPPSVTFQDKARQQLSKRSLPPPAFSQQMARQKSRGVIGMPGAPPGRVGAPEAAEEI